MSFPPTHPVMINGETGRGVEGASRCALGVLKGNIMTRSSPSQRFEGRL
jgi:hypothetical protein